jgi:hypothetical protein
VLPDKTYTLKGESWRGLKVNKERISVLVCANMDGSEKFLSIVAGKSKQLCFKNTKSLPPQQGCMDDVKYSGLFWTEE